MNKIKDLLLDINYMKDYAKNAASVITIDVSRYGKTMVDGYRMRNAVMARYQLDKLLLNEQSIIDKWAQFMVHDFDTNSVVFRGTEKECKEFINKHSVNYSWNDELELYWALPDDQNFSWTRYFNELEKRCGIEIEFIW